MKKYTVEEILKAGELSGNSKNAMDSIVSLLDEARKILKIDDKMAFGSIETQYFMLNKMLEKINITIEEILKTPNKTVNGIYWLDSFSISEDEYNIWRNWCREFLLNECTPKYSEAWIKTQFADWSLLYPFSIN